MGVRRLIAFTTAASTTLRSVRVPRVTDRTTYLCESMMITRLSSLFRAVLLVAVSSFSVNGHSATVFPDDVSWYRKQLIDGEVKPRLQSGMTPNGFYQPYLGRDWKPRNEQRGTLVSQTRAIYVMAAGYEVTGDKVYYDAMIKAADFLIE